MSIRHLGRLDGAVLVFGGSYGNLEATQALRDAAERHRIPAERVVYTGDVVAYGAVRVAPRGGEPMRIVAGHCGIPFTDIVVASPHD